MRVLVALTILLLAGCAMTSDVMDTGNGTYLISAHASAVRGGATGANRIAYQDANAFCAAKGGHAILIGNDERDLPVSGASGSYNRSGGSFGAFTAFGGNADMRFRCGQ